MNRRTALSIAILMILFAGLACNTPARVLVVTATNAPTDVQPSGIATTVAPATAPPTLSPPTPVPPTETPTIIPGEATRLDPCSLLPPDEAAILLNGETLGPPKVNGSACTYAEATQGVHVVSAYALQGELAKNNWSMRVFQLSAFGLVIDPASLEQIKAMDAAGQNKEILVKLSGLAAGNAAFTSRSLDGLGEVAWWVWKDLGNGVRHGFLIWVNGGTLAGIDLVHGANLDEPAIFDRVGQAGVRLNGRIPAQFTLGEPPVTVAPPNPTDTPTLVPTPLGGGSGLVVFESERQGDQIWVMDVNGYAPQMLTSRGGTTPNWSPDGSRIVYYSIRSGGVKLMVINADGTNEREIADNGYISGAPAWSPDGQRIAYVGRDGENLDIYLVNADGTGRMRLTDTLDDEWWPTWSPDGSRLAFASNRDQTTQVWIMDMETGFASALTSSVYGTFSSEPAWSPDGSWIAFVCNLYPQYKYGQICTLNLNDGGFAILTKNDMDNHDPSWSPDGAFLLFYAAPYQGNWDIYRMNPDGSGQTNLTAVFLAQDSFPAWQP